MFASIALPLPIPEALIYRVPPGLTVQVGCRALVPLGRRRVSGCVMACIEEVPTSVTAEVRDILEVLDDAPFVPAEIVSLAEWVAEYYMAAVGEAIASVVPPLSWVASKVALALSNDVGLVARARAGGGDAAALIEVLERQGPASIDTLIGRVVKATGGDLRLESGAGVRRVVRSLERAGVIGPEIQTTGRANASRTQRAMRVVRAPPDSVSVAAASVREATAAPAIAPAEALGIALTTRQRAALEYLSESGGEASLAQLIAHGHSASILKRLEAAGAIRRTALPVERDPFDVGAWHGVDEAPPAPEVVTLTDEQTRALDTLSAQVRTGAFDVSVLHGVTGSGKTEVYLRLVGLVLAAGRDALMMVPEIALTPAVVSRFRRAFGSRVAVQHSGLSDGERYDQWRRVRRGDVSVVVGTRSSVFAPLARLGLVIVDEEHDTSYKQEEAPRYHARDVAIVRAQRAGALVVLGSATPSLETYAHARSGRYRLIELKHRVAERAMATVAIVDMRQVYADVGPDVVLSPQLVAAIGTRLASGQQAVVLLNRRGFATTIVCRQCGGTVECPNCSVTLTVHRSARLAQCHYCDHSRPLPEQCRECGGPFVEYTGVGTERVEDELLKLFPSARVARVDRDTIRRRGAIGAVLARFARREIDVLVGTQMIAKGHDFPRVTLVGVVSADIGLGLADFRAAERTFQLLTQVAGRAGRGEQAGEAIVQTLHPGHYSIEFAKAQDFVGFFEREYHYRRAMRFPPHVTLVNVIVRGGSAHEALRDATVLMRLMGRADERFSLVGPAPAPLARLRGEHRAQFFVKVAHRAAARRALVRALVQRPDIARRATVDVDPQSVL